MPPLTPIKEEDKDSLDVECPNAPKKPDVQEHLFSSLPRLVNFEREVLDEDTDTDSTEDISINMDMNEIVFLHRQLKLVQEQHSYFSDVIAREVKKVRDSLNKIHRAKVKKSELESQSWSINLLLGRTDKTDYVGIE